MQLLLAFAVPVALVLAIDLGVFQRTPRDPTFREALAWTGVWVALAAMFGVGVAAQLGPARGAEYVAAYLVEQALSVDNLLVVMLIFGQLAIPPAAQRKVLAAGVLGAFAFRIALVAGGAELASRFHAVTYVLGGVLVAMAYKLVRGGGDDKSPPGVVRWLRRAIPVSREPDGNRLVTREAGRLRATPILLAIIVVELTDVVFALDSIPAVLGVTTHPIVAVTSNLFAVLGLRSLYFVITGLLGRLRHLEAGLALVLAFVGIKMLAGAFGIEVPVAVELAAIASILGGVIALSLRTPQPRSRS